MAGATHCMPEGVDGLKLDGNCHSQNRPSRTTLLSTTWLEIAR